MVTDQALLHGMEEELRDFLSADLLDVQVDPNFKERLRRELWQIVEQNAEKWRAARAATAVDGGATEPDSEGDGE